MSFKIRCPECNEKLEIDSPGRHSHVRCDCIAYDYCQTIGANVCLDKSRCKECWRRDTESDYCVQDEYIICNPMDDCQYFEEPDECEKASLCTYYYFHPVWHKIIHCPHCGSFNVDEMTEGVWKFHCFDCHDNFNLKGKNRNKTNSAEDKVESEQRRIQLIREYKSLLDEGLISYEEYNRKRDEIMNAIKL